MTVFLRRFLSFAVCLPLAAAVSAQEGAPLQPGVPAQDLASPPAPDQPQGPTLADRARDAKQALQALRDTMSEAGINVRAVPAAGAPAPGDAPAADGAPGEPTPDELLTTPLYLQHMSAELAKLTTALHGQALQAFDDLSELGLGGQLPGADPAAPGVAPGPLPPGDVSGTVVDLRRRAQLEDRADLVDHYTEMLERLTNASSALAALREAQIAQRLDSITQFISVSEALAEARARLGASEADWSLLRVPSVLFLYGDQGRAVLVAGALHAPATVESVRVEAGPSDSGSLTIVNDGCSGQRMNSGTTCEILLSYTDAPSLHAGQILINAMSDPGFSGERLRQTASVPFAPPSRRDDVSVLGSLSRDVVQIRRDQALMSESLLTLLDARDEAVEGRLTELSETVSAEQRQKLVAEQVRLDERIDELTDSLHRRVDAYDASFDERGRALDEVVATLAAWARQGFLPVEGTFDARADRVTELFERFEQLARWTLARREQVDQALAAVSAQAQTVHAELQSVAADAASAPPPLLAPAVQPPLPDAQGTVRAAVRPKPLPFPRRVALYAVATGPDAGSALFGYRDKEGAMKTVRLDDPPTPFAEGWTLKSIDHPSGTVTLSGPGGRSLTLP